MSLSSLMKDTVSLLKKNGEKTDGIKASVQKRKIFINRSDVLIETGDLIQRKMSNGGEETYEVIDPGFYERHGGIPAHYQMDVKKIELSEAKKTTQNAEIKVDLYADSLAKESKNLGYVNTGAKTIFISHANEDAVLARAIKTQIDNVFENKVNVFVSSITISPGSDWFDKILCSLTENDAFIVLVTPYSEKRPFVWFEIGFSWLRRLNNKCEIYAICAPPIDHGNLPEPLCRLQAISLAEEDRTIAFFEKLTKQFKLGNLDALKFTRIRDSLSTYPSQISQREAADGADDSLYATYSPEELKQVLFDILLREKKYHLDPVTRSPIFDGSLIDYKEFDEEHRLPVGTGKKYLKEVGADKKFQLDVEFEDENTIRFKKKTEFII